MLINCYNRAPKFIVVLLVIKYRVFITSIAMFNHYIN